MLESFNFRYPYWKRKKRTKKQFSFEECFAFHCFFLKSISHPKVAHFGSSDPVGWQGMNVLNYHDWIVIGDLFVLFIFLCFRSMNDRAD